MIQGAQWHDPASGKAAGRGRDGVAICPWLVWVDDQFHLIVSKKYLVDSIYVSLFAATALREVYFFRGLTLQKFAALQFDLQP